MKLPKKAKKFCKGCKKYTEHGLSQAKRKTPNSHHPMGYGSKKRAKKRGVLGCGNQGKYSKPPIKKWKMCGKKQSKKIDLRFKCGTCKRSQITTEGFRARRVEFVWNHTYYAKPPQNSSEYDVLNAKTNKSCSAKHPQKSHALYADAH